MYHIKTKIKQCHIFIFYRGDGYSGCNIDIDDIPGLVGRTDNDYLVTAGYRGKSDGTSVNGIKIDKSSGSFRICFDPTKVGGTQSYSQLGLVDSYGNGESCTVYNLFPDFCGGEETTTTSTTTTTTTTTPEPTTPSPTTPSPTTAGNIHIICAFLWSTEIT